MKKIVSICLLVFYSTHSANQELLLFQENPTTCTSKHAALIAYFQQNTIARDRYYTEHKQDIQQFTRIDNNILFLENGPCCTLPLALLPDTEVNSIQSLQFVPVQSHPTVLRHTTFNNLPNLETVLLNRMYIGKLPLQLFATTPKLKRAILSKTELREVTYEQLRQFAYAHFLDLTYNHLQIVPMFPPLTNLTTLRLTGNSITHFRNNCFEDLPNLNALSIRNKYIGNATRQALKAPNDLIIESRPHPSPIRTRKNIPPTSPSQLPATAPAFPPILPQTPETSPEKISKPALLPTTAAKKNTPKKQKNNKKQPSKKTIKLGTIHE